MSDEAVHDDLWSRAPVCSPNESKETASKPCILAVLSIPSPYWPIAWRVSNCATIRPVFILRPCQKPGDKAPGITAGSSKYGAPHSVRLQHTVGFPVPLGPLTAVCVLFSTLGRRVSPKPSGRQLWVLQ